MESELWHYFMIFYLPAMFVGGLIAAIVAPKRGRDKVWWSILCFIFPPFLILLFILPRGRTWHERHPLDDAHLGDGWPN